MNGDIIRFITDNTDLKPNKKGSVITFETMYTLIQMWEKFKEEQEEIEEEIFLNKIRSCKY